jgi:hypothetical protein
MTLVAGYAELLIFCSDDELAGRARPGKTSFFQTHHAADVGGGCAW